MKVIVPMAGTGARFVNQGYADPKPLIRLACDGRRIIEHVLDMFREPDDEFVFICNETHLNTTSMRTILKELVPGCTVVSIPEHKLGPVWTLLPAFCHIRDDEEVIVSYCDGTLKWDREDFKRKVKGMDGCLFTHTGFHPHTLSSTKMAFILADSGGTVLEVKEKASYTDNPMNEHASSGVYYFRRGDQLHEYSNRLISENLHYNGEFYVTLLYNLLIADGLKVGYYDTDFVAILGTPEEVRNFEAWSVIARNPHIKNSADLCNLLAYWKNYWK